MARRRVTIGGTLVLDSDGLCKLAAKDQRARAYHDSAVARGAQVVVSAITLAEVLRGSARDAALHRVLSRIITVPVSASLGRAAGELLGLVGLTGHRCAVDSVVAATALVMSRPVVVLTSDPEDLSRLVEEPHCPKEHQVAIVRI
ncbi:type II toxin-antitoxin system VapC family toxin [Fodinicola feengrottensis]|uniref:PIN domain-containing protein n=1 Tax=Fodinicola feengrottensis TaxID=435914 RepID=A0ABN2GW20_9ACTN|nr:PIN domain-containing protein [Fodinicola feengrottensis]